MVSEVLERPYLVDERADRCRFFASVAYGSARSLGGLLSTLSGEAMAASASE